MLWALVWPFIATSVLCLDGAKIHTVFTPMTDASSIRDRSAYNSPRFGRLVIRASDLFFFFRNTVIITSGTLVGLGINYAKKEIFITRNGVLLGTPAKRVRNLLHMHPTIGIRSLDNKCRVNFGQRPFEFDIVNYMRELEKEEETTSKWPLKLYSQISMQSLLVKCQYINDHI